MNPIQKIIDHIKELRENDPGVIGGFYPLPPEIEEGGLVDPYPEGRDQEIVLFKLADQRHQRQAEHEIGE